MRSILKCVQCVNLNVKQPSFEWNISPPLFFSGNWPSAEYSPTAHPWSITGPRRKSSWPNKKLQAQCISQQTFCFFYRPTKTPSDISPFPFFLSSSSTIQPSRPQSLTINFPEDIWNLLWSWE
ncbi:hypothetical protein Droror1_Dr00027939 [Drosera rotundifolia]